MNTFRLDVTTLYVSVDVGLFEQNLFSIAHESYLVLQATDGIQGPHEDICELSDGIKVLPGVHWSPINFLILYRVRGWGFNVFSLRMSATAECDILSHTAICWRVKSLSKMNSLNFVINSFISLFASINIIIMTKSSLSRFFFNYFRFLFIPILW